MLIAIGGGVLLLLLLGIGAMLLLRKRKRPVEHPNMAKALKEGDVTQSAAELDDPNAELERKIAEQAKADLAAIAALKLPTVTTKKGELLTKEISASTKKDASVPAHVLQTWLHEND